MCALTRRNLLKSGLAGVAALNVSNLAWADDTPVTKRKNRIRQSVSRWCYHDTPLDKLCIFAKSIGMSGIDLLQPEDFEVPARYGLVCSMSNFPGVEIADGFNRLENHAALEASLRKYMPMAAKANIKRLAMFSGNRNGMDDETGLKNTIIGLKRADKIAADNGMIICMELLNSRHDHHDYMCDHSSWGLRAVQEVNSPNVRLLYDIYHMQIMDGDLVATIKENIQWISHFHTGGVPGRHELDGTQEVNWACVMRAIAETNYDGYVAHEFVPSRDPFTSLREAVDLCDV